MTTISIQKNQQKIRSFTDLRAWQEAHKLVLMIYKAATKFPPEEKFCLKKQICSAAASITSNIAEGFSRRSAKEKRQFYYQALASLTEVQNQTYLSQGVDYISKDVFEDIAEQTIITSKLINGLIKYLKKNHT